MKILSPFHNYLFYKSCVLPCPIIQWINHTLIFAKSFVGVFQFNAVISNVNLSGVWFDVHLSFIIFDHATKEMEQKNIYKYLKFSLGRKWTTCKCICLGILLPQSITGIKDNCRPHRLSYHITLVVAVGWSYLLFDVKKKQKTKTKTIQNKNQEKENNYKINNY